ncbi:hypothetical protein LTR50_005818 [Elasticomyces elasticus]|nr:hypothetical protein LTR50_005818 [Elasticomyces elasticus]
MSASNSSASPSDELQTVQVPARALHTAIERWFRRTVEVNRDMQARMQTIARTANTSATGHRLTYCEMAQVLGRIPMDQSEIASVNRLFNEGDYFATEEEFQEIIDQLMTDRFATIPRTLQPQIDHLASYEDMLESSSLTTPDMLHPQAASLVHGEDYRNVNYTQFRPRQLSLDGDFDEFDDALEAVEEMYVRLNRVRQLDRRGQDEFIRRLRSGTPFDRAFRSAVRGWNQRHEEIRAERLQREQEQRLERQRQHRLVVIAHAQARFDDLEAGIVERTRATLDETRLWLHQNPDMHPIYMEHIVHVGRLTESPVRQTDMILWLPLPASVRRTLQIEADNFHEMIEIRHNILHLHHGLGNRTQEACNDPLHRTQWLTTYPTASMSGIDLSSLNVSPTILNMLWILCRQPS